MTTKLKSLGMREGGLQWKLQNEVSERLGSRSEQEAAKYRLLFTDKEVRKLVVEMHAVFQDCCKISKTEGKLSTNAALDLSRSYRSVLLATAQSSERGREQYVREFALWSLFEIMFLRKGDTSIMIDLMEWANQCFLFVNEAINRFAQEAEDIASPSDAAFWRAVVCSLIGCRFEACASLLKHCERDPAVRLLIEFLDRLEYLHIWLNDDSKSEKFSSWQEDLRRSIHAKQFEANPNIQFIVHMLVGEQETLCRMAGQLTKEWWQMMPLFVLLNNSQASFNALGSLADDCFALAASASPQLHSQEQTDPFLAIFHVSDLTFLENIFANPWLSVHLVDLLLNTGSEFAAPLSDLRDFLLLDYGSCLINYSGLWEVGVEYLLECGEEGRKQADKLMLTCEIEDEPMAEKTFRIASEYCLRETVRHIVKTMSSKYISCKEWSAALGWALRTDDTKLIDGIVNKIIWSATDKEISMLDVFEQLEDVVCHCSSLHFLYNYYWYLKLLHKGDANRASKILFELVISPEVPPAFHETLFAHLRLMLSDEIQISTSRARVMQLNNFLFSYKSDHRLLMNEDQLSMIKSLSSVLSSRLKSLSESDCMDSLPHLSGRLSKPQSHF